MAHLYGVTGPAESLGPLSHWALAVDRHRLVVSDISYIVIQLEAMVSMLFKDVGLGL
jgi:hypothetical protein